MSNSAIQSLILAIFCVLPGPSAIASSVDRLQHDWAVASYELAGDAQVQALTQLASQADSAVSSTPNDPAILIWTAIIKSSLAGKAGGFGALGLVKEAKKLLEQSISIDSVALDASAFTSLGSLYYQVPGWPLGFGNDKKARKYLTDALAVNPDGIDPNYFYGDFLFEEGEYDQAEVVLMHALSAAPRAGRELADSGRREEIRALLEKVQQNRGG